MKQFHPFTIFLLVCSFLFTFSQQGLAQAGGTKPELVMYRHNSGPGGALPVLPNDLLGALKWDALTAINMIRTGASIHSFATSVVPGTIQANMIFRTSGPPTMGIADRMIITQDGRVGIGTNFPSNTPAADFMLHTVGNTHTTGDFYGRIHFDVGMPTNLPSSYIDEAYFERKNRVGLGLAPNAYADGGILSLAPGGNSLHRQLFVGGNDGIWTRSQNLLDADSWEAWYRLLTSEDIEGHVGRIPRFTGTTLGDLSSALHDSQLFDNGTNVTIGGSHPPTPPAAANLDVNYRLTVNGIPAANAARINGNTRIEGNLGIGKAPSTAFDLDVAGESNFDGRVKIGANAFPTSITYELAVGGGIIAEEVLVRLQPWPDYVFENSDNLMPLRDVEQFTKENHRLPGVTSATEIAENGLNLGDMQKVQMEKIEELFLHLISLEKRVQELEAENAALKTKVEQSGKRN